MKLGAFDGYDVICGVCVNSMYDRWNTLDYDWICDRKIKFLI